MVHSILGVIPEIGMVTREGAERLAMAGRAQRWSVGARSWYAQARLRMCMRSHAVHVGMVESLGIMQQGKTFEDFPHLAQAANRLLDHMSWWAKTLKPAREGMTSGVAAREQSRKAVTVTA